MIDVDGAGAIHTNRSERVTEKIRSAAFRTSAVYWLIVVGWVFLTKFGVDYVVSGRNDLSVISVLRLSVFATVTSFLLYLLIVKLTLRFENAVAEHARAEEALRKNERHLNAAQSLAHMGSWEWDRIAKKVSWSDEMFELFKIERENFTGDPNIIAERIHPDDVEMYREAITAPLENGVPLPHPVEFRIVLPGGEVRILISLNPPESQTNADADHVMGVVQDITEIKRQQEALCKSEEILRRAESVAHVGNSSWDPMTDTTIWSDEMYVIAGRDFNLPPPGYSDRASIYPPESWQRYYAALKKTIETGEPYDLNIQIRRPDGEIRDVRVRGEVDRDAKGRLIKVVGTMQDITDERQRDEALRLQASALQSAANAIAITDRSGAMIYVNDAFTKLTGYSADEVRGKEMRILNSGKQDAVFYMGLWNTITAGKVWRAHLVNKRKDGSLYIEEEVITPVRINGGDITHFIAIKRDITGQIRAEETLKSSMTQLRELSARLEKVREEERKALSHEVHDELGQILTAIKMRLLAIENSELDSEEEFGSRIRASVLLVDEAIRSVRDIAGRLRPGVLDYLGLIPAIEWQIEQFQRNFGIRCKLVKPGEEPDIDDERSTVLFRILQEALTNVARHARATSVEISLSEYDGEFIISVTDNGVGISQQDIENPRSFGLLGIRERLRPFDGKCMFLRRESGGTELLINLPGGTK